LAQIGKYEGMEKYRLLEEKDTIIYEFNRRLDNLTDYVFTEGNSVRGAGFEELDSNLNIAYDRIYDINPYLSKDDKINLLEIDHRKINLYDLVDVRLHSEIEDLLIPLREKQAERKKAIVNVKEKKPTFVEYQMPNVVVLE
jgi:hypothetical protein